MQHTVLDLSEPGDLTTIGEVIENEPVAFLIGSAVSSFAPSALPSGQEIVSQVSSYLLRDEQAELGTERYRRLSEFTEAAAFEHLFEHYPKPNSLKAYFSRAFAGSDCNVLHEAIAEISAETGAPIITTNYDELLEGALRLRGNLYNRIVSERDLQAYPARHPTIFKIHGCISEPQSIVLRMSEEGMLREWKYDLFSRLLQDRTLIAIGYSGQDFEICPAIQTTNIRMLCWNIYGYKADLQGVSANLRHLVEHKQRPFPFTVLAGDMADLLGVTDAKRDWTKSGIQSFLEGDLDSEQAAVWRASFFDSIAAPHAVERQFAKLQPEELKRAKSGYHYRRGEYLSSHLSVYPNGRKRVQHCEEQLRSLLDRSFKYRNAGLPRTAKAACVDAHQLWSDLPVEKKALHEDGVLWSVILNLPVDSEGTWEEAATRLEKLRHEAGNWGGIYNLRIHLKHRGYDGLASPERLHDFLEARDGYDHIGNVSAYVDEFTRASYEEDCAYYEFEERINVAELFDLSPNVYKCCYAALRAPNVRGLALRLSLFWKCIRFMMRCEYSGALQTYLIFWASVALIRPNWSRQIS